MTLEQLSAMTKENQESRARKKLESYVVNSLIFMDTCSILSPYAEKFFENIDPLLEHHDKKIIIPTRCMEELNKHLHNTGSSDPHLPQKADHAIHLIQNLQARDRIRFLGDEDDSFADNVFHVAFTKLRMNDSLLLITEDQKLARDILRLNDSESVRAHPVACQRLSRYGYLAQYPFESRKTETPIAPHSRPTYSAKSDTYGGRIVICQDCGSQFELAAGEVKFYQSKKLELPKRCKKCRSSKKGQAAHAPAAANTDDWDIYISPFPDIESIPPDKSTDAENRQSSVRRKRRKRTQRKSTQSIISYIIGLCMLAVSIVSGKLCLNAWYNEASLVPMILSTLKVLFWGLCADFLLYIPLLRNIPKGKHRFRTIVRGIFTLIWMFLVATGVFALVLHICHILFQWIQTLF